MKTAAEVLRRHEQQLQAQLHQRVVVDGDAGRITVTLDIVTDDDEPSALLSATNAGGDLLAQVSVSPGFRLNASSASRWIADDFRRPD